MARTAALLGLFTLVACQTAPPVQEMSDARQAIAVAKKAGAEEYAAADLERAISYLKSAERKLNERDYHNAREDAIEARSRARQALAVSESGREPL